VNPNRTAGALCLTALLLVACESGPQPAAPNASVVITTDSAGRRVVTSSAPQLPANFWSVEPDPLVVLGDEARPLHQVTTARRLPDGRVAVLQRSPPGVLLFDRTGDVVRTLVREGDGPGEIRLPVHLHFHAPDTLWTWSAMYGPAYAVDTAGTLLAERHWDWVRLQRALGDSLSSENFLPLYSGAVVAMAGPRTPTPPDPPGGEWTLIEAGGARVQITPDYQAMHLGTFHGTGGAVNSKGRVALAFAMPVSHAATSPDRFHLAFGDTYAVDVYSLDGTHLHQIRKTGPAAQWDDTTFQRQRREWLDRYGLAFGPDEAQRAWEALPDQRFFPPINGLVADIAGGVWVRESLHRWNVFDDTGAWVTSIDVPLHRIFEVGADYIIGIARDLDDVETVVELSLQRTSSKF
jgi:hypothetical protein